MAKQTREERLADVAFVRNYVIDVLATAMIRSQGQTTDKMVVRLAEQEAKIMDILDQH